MILHEAGNTGVIPTRMMDLRLTPRRPAKYITPMAENNLDSSISELIASFVTELTAKVKSAALASVQDALGSGPVSSGRLRGLKRGPKPGRKPGRPAGSGKKTGGKREKRTSEQVEKLASRVLTYVKSHPGHGLEQIGKGLGLPTKVLKLPVQKLLEAKAVRTTGQRRGTKYHAR